MVRDLLVEYRVTFGSGHAGQPIGNSGIVTSPDGWVTVYAESELAARGAALILFGRAWSDVSAGPWPKTIPRKNEDEDDLRWESFYPLGALAIVTATTTVRIDVEPPLQAPCPECAAGKHANCDGRTWDVLADDYRPCPCAVASHEVSRA